MAEHYFFERFISVGIYALITVILVYFLQKEGSTTFKFKVFLLVITVLSYFFIPSSTMDLYRLRITAAEYWNSFSLSELLEILSTYSSPLGVLYIAVICRVNSHLLPAITAFLFYNNIFYIIDDYSKKKNIDSSVIAAVTFLYLSRGVYTEVISGIRCMLAFSFVARCIYNEIYNKKNILLNLPIYLAAIFFHSASLILVLVRFVFKVLIEERGIRRVFFFAILLVASIFYMNFFGLQLNATIEKANGYLTEETYSYVWEYVFNSIYLIIAAMIIYGRSRWVSTLSDSGKALKWNVCIYILICLVFWRTYSIYHRYISFVAMISLPVIMEIVDKELKENENYVIVTNLAVLSIIILLLSGIKGNLNGLRYFTL